MGIRAVIHRRIPGQVSLSIVSILLIAAGLLIVVLAQTRNWDEIAAVGVLYGLIGLGTLLVIRVSSDRIDIRFLWYGLTLILLILFIYVFGELLWNRTPYIPPGLQRVLIDPNPSGAVEVGLVRFLRVAPVGMFLLLGFAERRSERLYAVPPVIILITFLIISELVRWYSGFGWPELALLSLGRSLGIILLAGVALYVHGIVLRTATRTASKTSS